MLSDLQKRQFERAERAYLEEPREVTDTPTCELCGGYPVDDFLYNTEKGWLCADCTLDLFERRDIYSD